MAAIEGSAIVPNTWASQERRHQELRELDRRLDAVRFLNNAKITFNIAEAYSSKSSKKFYFLRYDSEKNEVKVSSYSSFRQGLYDEHEGGKQAGKITSVLVEVDKVESLRAAYPNYFMDVSSFSELLAGIVGKASNFENLKITRDLGWLDEYNTRRRR